LEKDKAKKINMVIQAEQDKKTVLNIILLILFINVKIGFISFLSIFIATPTTFVLSCKNV
jgi:hypothetical protein